MGVAIRPFLDLLPYRLDQALIGSYLRKARIRHRRSRPIFAFPQPSTGPRRLFVDMSVISRHDAGTGIQRVVRALALSLIDEVSEGWDVRFVAATRRKAYCRISWPDPRTPVHSDGMEGRPGDVFLGLDYSLDAVRHHASQLACFRRSGGKLWFLIHDLLPLERPDWFGRNTEIRYKAWLDILAGVADGFLCNSDHTEVQLRCALSNDYGLTAGYATKVLPMGHRILESVRHCEAGEVCDLPKRPGTSNPFFLMVGTLEPRKGHAEVITAFEELWQAGMQEGLVMVGRMGWQVENLRDRILMHPLYGEKLFWFDDVDDPELERMYAACQGSIIASYAEGFGLPLIEALGHGKPVLARDLAVFRPHAGNGACYFPADANTQVLAQCVRQWAEDVRSGRIMVISPGTSWHQSARDLISTIT